MEKLSKYKGDLKNELVNKNSFLMLNNDFF